MAQYLKRPTSSSPLELASYPPDPQQKPTATPCGTDAVPEITGRRLLLIADRGDLADAEPGAFFASCVFAFSDG